MSTPHTNLQVPRVLSIAGTDPTGGAGIHADLKSFAAAGGYGMGVVTAIVSQNTHGVRDVFYPPLKVLRAQLDAVSDDVHIDAIKIGMLGNADVTATVAGWLDAAFPEAATRPPLVIDPVMVSTSGHVLLDDAGRDRLRSLLPAATVITPNLPELALLAGTPVRDNLDEAVADAAALAAELGCAIVVKGGHAAGADAANVLVQPHTQQLHSHNELDLPAFPRVTSPRVDTPHTHGTGCSLSAAIATRLGWGEDLLAALEWSTNWLHGAIAAADELHVGSGRGPVDHFHHLREFVAPRRLG